MIGTSDARASFNLGVAASCGVATLALTAACLGWAVDRFAEGTSSSLLSGWTALCVAVASGLFVAAGVFRLARWRLAHDPHSALVGAALILMGGLCLPLGGFAQLLVPGEDSSVVGTAVRSVATGLAMMLVLRAVREADFRPRHRPGQLLPRLFAIVGLVFALLLTLENVVPHVLTDRTLPPAVLSAAMALAWFALGLRVALRCHDLSWAYRAAPLFLGMGLAETFRALDFGRVEVWTFSATLLCALMAALATRSALIDLDRAMTADRHRLTHLSVDLDRVRGKADELTVWREQLTHDARNACAGVRAAMDILQRYEGHVDAGTTQRLRLAAVEEIGYLEHLLFRSSSVPCEQFEAGEVVRLVGETARSLGTQVRVEACRAPAVGRPGDVAAVLRSLLVNARTHAPGSRVDLRVTATRDTVRITCSDNGPGLGDVDPEKLFDRGYRGLTSPGSGLGLYAARELMREQDGDLTIGTPRPGATFELTLPAAPPATRPAAPTPVSLTELVPAQRRTSSAPSPLELI